MVLTTDTNIVLIRLIIGFSVGSGEGFYNKVDYTFESGGSYSRIDLCFLNQAAARGLNSVEVKPLDPDGPKQHHLLEVSFSFRTDYTQALSVKKPKGFPHGPEVGAEDKSRAEEEVMAQHAHKFWSAFEDDLAGVICS